MHASLEDVEFLSRSESRVQVLEAIAEHPRSRHELRELTGASRVTVNRILDDLEDRNWIVRENGRSRPTPMGTYVAAEFDRLLANVDVAAQLDGALDWLPTETFDFDLACLRDAQVIRTTDWEAHTATISRMTELVHTTDTVRGTALGFSHEIVEAIRDVTRDGGTTFEAVVADSALQMIRSDDGLRERFVDVLATDGAQLAHYMGPSPLQMVFCFDETVVICGHDSEGPPPGTVVSEDAAVLDWAEGYYRDARRAAEPLTAADLRPEATGSP